MDRSFSSHIGRRFSRELFLICLLCGSLQAQKIKVEYDKNLNFAEFKTFAWGPLDAVARPLLAASIQGAIEEELTKRGLHKVAGNPDVFLEMYGSVDSDMSVTYSNPLYSGMGGIPSFDSGFVMWGAMAGGTTAVTVHKGQLVVDVIEAHSLLVQFSASDEVISRSLLAVSGSIAPKETREVLVRRARPAKAESAFVHRRFIPPRRQWSTLPDIWRRRFPGSSACRRAPPPPQVSTYGSSRTLVDSFQPATVACRARVHVSRPRSTL
jgi:hypothetical protein